MEQLYKPPQHQSNFQKDLILRQAALAFFRSSSSTSSSASVAEGYHPNLHLRISPLETELHELHQQWDRIWKSLRAVPLPSSTQVALHMCTSDEQLSRCR